VTPPPNVIQHHFRRRSTINQTGNAADRQRANFYADDGLITGTDREAVQFCLDLVTYLFAIFGLNMNAAKTKLLVGRPNIPLQRLSKPAFHQRIKGERRTFESNNRQQVGCHICGLELKQRSLK
jgi:hypothetical protein